MALRGKRGPKLPPIPGEAERAWLAGVLDSGFSLNLKMSQKLPYKPYKVIAFRVGRPEPVIARLVKITGGGVYAVRFKPPQTWYALTGRTDTLAWLMEAVMPYASKNTIKKFTEFLTSVTTATEKEAGL